MNIYQFRRLKKFMMMTMSGSEVEVAMAIRKANEAVVEAGTDWNKILDRVVKVELEIESVHVATGRSDDPADRAAARTAFAKRVNEAFVALESTDPRGDFADFIASLKSQWEQRSSLTGPQLEALFKSAKKTGRFE